MSEPQFQKLEEEQEGPQNIVDDNFVPQPYRQEGREQRGKKEGIPDPRAFKAQSLEEQLRLQEELNKIMLEESKSKRKNFRIFMQHLIQIIFIKSLIVCCLVLVGGFILIKKYLAFGKGSVILESGSSLEIVMANCTFEIIESNSAKSPPLKLEYYVPGMFNIDMNGPTSEASVLFNITSSKYFCNFTNIINGRSCHASLYVHKSQNKTLMTLKDLNFTCAESSKCLFIWKMDKFLIDEGVTIRGDEIYLNADQFSAGFIDLEVTKGIVQLNSFNFKDGGQMHLKYGDIIAQSVEDFSVNWTSALPSYCMSSPHLASSNIQGCEIPDLSPYLVLDEEDEEGSNETKSEEEEAKEEESKEAEKKHLKRDQDLQQRIEDLVWVEEKNAQMINQLLEYLTKQQKNATRFLESQNKKNFIEALKTNLYHKPATVDEGASGEGAAPADEAAGDTETKEEESSKEGEDDDDEEEEEEEEGEPKKKKLQFGAELKLPPTCFGLASLCQNTSVKCKHSKSKEKMPEFLHLKEEKTPKLDMPLLNVSTMTGSLFMNIISAPKIPVDKNDTKTLKGKYYKKDYEIDWSLPLKRQLIMSEKLADDPKNFDPVYIFKLGSKESNSSLFTQWQLTYNPAYTYLRPWWISTFSFTLLSTATYDLSGDLTPGFCPFHPALNVENLFDVQSLIKKEFINATRKIVSMAYDHKFQPPSINYAESDGFRNISRLSTLEFENWYSLQHFNETTFSYEKIECDFMTKITTILSLILSVLVGFILLMLCIYTINKIYIDVIEFISQTAKYKSLDVSIKPEDAEVVAENSNQSSEVQGLPQGKAKKPELSNNPYKLLCQLYLMAPPLSAFIDYLCVTIFNRQRDSGKEFFQHIFSIQKKPRKNDSEIHNIEREQIKGRDFKNLYEKFCYLENLLEQKLDEPQFVQELKNYGYEVITRDNSQSQILTNIKFKSEVPGAKFGDVVVQQSKQDTSFNQFLQSCCDLSSFEADNIESDDLLDAYQYFCQKNHLQFEMPSQLSLEQDHSIKMKYVAQQWVVRIEEQPDVSQSEEDKQNPGEQPQPQQSAAGTPVTGWVMKTFGKYLKKKQPTRYFIDRNKLQNQFYLMYDAPELIKTKSELYEAQTEKIMFHGWYIWDAGAVVAHILTIIILVSPQIIWPLFQNTQYAIFSLQVPNSLIFFDEVFENFWIIPEKLYYSESVYIKIFIYIMFGYLAFALFDLIFYYKNMQFPLENYFKKSSAASSLSIFQHIMRIVMWNLVLFSLLIVCIAVSLALVWLVLGAIVNPTAFLPVATSAAVFVTLITSKYAEFKSVLDSGFQAIIDYLKSKAEGQFAGVMKKMDLQGKVKAAVNSDMLKTFAQEGEKLGLVKGDMLADLQKNADKICQNPLKAAEQMGGELSKIAEDPGKFLQDQLAELENKLWEKLAMEINEQLKGNIGSNLVMVIKALLSNDKELMKQNLQKLFVHFIKAISSDINIPFATLNVLWNFAFLKDPKIHPIKLQQLIMRDLAATISEFLKNVKVGEADVGINFSQNSIEKFFDIILKIQNREENFQEAIIENLSGIIREQSTKEGFGKEIFQCLNSNKFIFDLLKIAIHLCKPQINFSEVRELITDKFLKNFLEKLTKKSMDPTIIQFFDMCTQGLATSFEAIEFKQIKQICDSTKQAISGGAEKQLKILEPQFNLIQSYFAFLRSQIHQLPDENIAGLLEIALQLEEQNENSVKVLSEMNKCDNQFMYLIEQIKQFYKIFIYFNEKPQQLEYQIINNAQIYNITDPRKINQYRKIFCFKFPCFQTNIDEFYKFKIISTVSKKLRITPELIVGILSFSIQAYERLEIQTLFETMLKLAKIPPSKKSIIINLFHLMTAQEESLLYNGAVALGIPPKFVPLILIAKKIIEPKYITDQEWMELGLDYSKDSVSKLINESHELNIYSKQREETKKFNLWIEKMGVEFGNSIVFNQVLGGDDNKCKVQLITWKDFPNLDAFKLCLSNLKNLKNQFSKLKQSEVEFILKFQNLQNINTLCSNAFDQASKNTIISLANLLNIEEICLDNMMSLFFLQSQAKVISSFRFFYENFDDVISTDEQDYIKYCLTQVEKIALKHSFIQTEVPQMFLEQKEQIIFPSQLYTKILLNPREKISSQTYFQLLEGLCDDKSFTVALQQSKGLISLIQSSMRNTHPLELLKLFGFKSSGICTILTMANTKSIERCRNELLDYLGSLQHGLTYQIFLCLKAVFEGKTTGLEIKTKEGEILTCTRFLHLQTGVPEEWFQMLPYLFTSNISEFVDVMIKYFRRIEALNNPKVPPQSLVKINPKLVECLLQFIKGQSYNQQILSKEYGIPEDAVQFGSTLQKMSMQKTTDNQVLTIEKITKDQSFCQILNKLDIKHNEFKIILEILYSLIDIFKVHETLQILKIEDVDESILMSLLAMDESVDMEGQEGYDYEIKLIQSSSNLWKKAIAKQSGVRNNTKFEKFTQNTMVFSKIISQGQISFLQYHDQFDEWALANSPDLKEFFYGMSAIISCPPSNSSYKKNLQYLYRDIRNNQKIEPENTTQFGIFTLLKYMNISPTLANLIIGDLNCWEYFQVSYYIVNQNSPSLNVFENPILLLLVIINYLKIPRLIKEYLTNYEWIQSTKKLYQSKIVQEQVNNNSVETSLNNWERDFNISKEQYDDIWAECWNDFKYTQSDIMKIAKKFGFDVSVLNSWYNQLINNEEEVNKALNEALIHMIQSTLEADYAKDNQHQNVLSYLKTQKIGKIDVNMQEILENLQLVAPYKNEIKKICDNFYVNLFDQVLSEVVKDFPNPRKPKVGEEFKRPVDQKSWFSHVVQFYSEDQAIHYNLTALSLILQLRTSYYQIDGEVDRKDVHKQTIAQSFDLLLSIAEKYNFYNNAYNKWSKIKMIAVLCPAAGFWIDIFEMKPLLNETLFSEQLQITIKDQNTELGQFKKKLQFFSSFFVEINHSIMKKIDTVKLKQALQSKQFSAIKTLTSDFIIEEQQQIQVGQQPKQIDDNQQFIVILSKLTTVQNLFDIWKQDYQNLNSQDNALFSNLSQAQTQTFSNMLSLSGMATSIGNREYIQNIDQICEGLLSSIDSNKINIILIIKFLLGITDNISLFATKFDNCNADKFQAFMKLSTWSNQSSNLDTILLQTFLQNFKLAQSERSVLNQIFSLSSGNISPVIELTKPKYTLNSKFPEQGHQIFKSLLWSFDFESILNIPDLKPERFDIIDQSIQYYDRNLLYQKFSLQLFEVASLVQNFDKTSNLQEPIEKLIIGILANLFDNDFSIFLTKKDEKSENMVIEAFKNLRILQDNPKEELDKISSILLFKKEKLINSEEIDFQKCLELVKSQNLINIPDAKLQMNIYNLLYSLVYWDVPLLKSSISSSVKPEMNTIGSLVSTLYYWSNVSVIQYLLSNNGKSKNIRVNSDLEMLFDNEIIYMKFLTLNLKMLFAFLYRNWLIKQSKRLPSANQLKQKEIDKINQQITIINKALQESKCKKLSTIIENQLQNPSVKQNKFIGKLTWLYMVKFLNQVFKKSQMPNLGPGSVLEELITGRIFQRLQLNLKQGNEIFKFVMYFAKLALNLQDQVGKQGEDQKQEGILMKIFNVQNPLESLGNLMDKATLEIFFPFLKLLLILTIAMQKSVKAGDDLKQISSKVLTQMINNLNNSSFFAELNQEGQQKIAGLLKVLNEFLSNPEMDAITLLLAMKIFDSPNSGNSKFSFQKLLDICGKVFVLTGNSTKSLANQEYVKQIEDLAGDIFGLFTDNSAQLKQILVSVLNVAQGKFEYLYKILKSLVENDNTRFQFLKEIIDNSQKTYTKIMGSFGPTTLIKQPKPKLDEEITQLMEKIKTGKANPHDLFIAIDREGNGNGKIDKSEFKSLSSKLGISLTDHRINEIFSSLKQGSTEDEELNESEFTQGLEYLQSKNCGMSLEFLGISPAALAIALFVLATIVLLLLAFIYFGVQAFAIGGGFGAVINSIMPLSAGMKAGGKSEDKQKSLEPQNISKIVDKSNDILQTNQI